MPDIRKQSRTYLDYAATTPVHPEVIDRMVACYSATFGNPSSSHQYGQEADNLVEEARQSVAAHFNARAEDVIFTSGGTEADNLAIRGTAAGAQRSGKTAHILYTAVEHHAVSVTCEQLHIAGVETERVPVGADGIVDPDEIRQRIRQNTVLVTVIFANNEIGSINPVGEIGRICRERGVLFHSDAVQAAAHLPINMDKESIDLLSIGAHKFYGPKGVGALIWRGNSILVPQITGGRQENDLRAGTSNVPGIVGMAAALERLTEGMGAESRRLAQLRDKLIETIPATITDCVLTGSKNHRLPNHASFAFRNLEANRMLAALDMAGFACSSGSACKTGDPQPSEILLAMGYAREYASGSLRITVGSATTEADVDRLVQDLPVIVRRLRGY